MKANHQLITALAISLPVFAFSATQVDIFGPLGNEQFGHEVTVLPNGNFVVTDPLFDQESPPVPDVGAVYLYSTDGQLISTLTGSSPSDNVGGAVQVLANGNFIVRSLSWDNGTVTDAGAVTWGSATTGFIGGTSVVVSASNSLVGSSTSDEVSSGSDVTILNNGNYVVRSPSWDNGATDVGAVTWGNGATGTTGEVSASNSLVGSSMEDYVGTNDIIVLSNGNYVVPSPLWDGASGDVGAVTWCNGSNGFPSGESNPGATVSMSNSLTGGTVGDIVGSPGVTALTNGNYVVASSSWDDPAGPVVDVGAATLCDGGTGRAGTVTAANSLIGGTTGDQVGVGGVTPLINGNYVVRSYNWIEPVNGTSRAGAVTWCDGTTGVPPAETNPGVKVSATNSLIGSTRWDYVGIQDVVPLTNGNFVVCVPNWDVPGTSLQNVGAATWGNGTSGITGTLSAANSLIGSSLHDSVGDKVIALTNGNYVVCSVAWDNGTAMDAGAATWGNGTTGVKGTVSAANSLIGGKAGDNVSGDGVFALTNGNYVVNSPFWDPPVGSIEDVGAVTWGSGSVGVKGLVSAANSLIGGSARDSIGSRHVTALTNGNYVVASSNWDNPAGPISDAGAVTWGNGSSGIKGLVSAANSLIGSSAGDIVGGEQVTALTNGNYVVASPYWDNAALATSDAGAVTWGSGTTGAKGTISVANSLVGSTDGDKVGRNDLIALANGNYVVVSHSWDNPATLTSDSGALTLGNGAVGTTGPVVVANSVLGTTDNEGENLTFGYDSVREQFIVGRPGDGVVTRMGNLFRTLAKTGTAAPGALDMSFGTPGTAAVNEEGRVLADFTLTGAGSTGGRSKALFGNPVFGGPLDLVMQLGDSLSGLGGGLPANAKATVLSGHVTQQIGRGLFFATLSGTGITATNNRLLLRDNGASVSLLRRTGQLIPGLGMPSVFREVVQNHDHDLMVLSYQLKSSTTAPIVSATSDTGLLPLTHGGSIINANISVREGQPAFGAGGVFGEFSGRAVGGVENTIHFAAALKTGAPPVAALFKMTEDGLTTARTAKVGESAPGAEPATFGSFPALGQTRERALFKATITGPSTQNEGLWREGDLSFLVRKGVTEVLSGVKVASIIRFWPSRSDQVVFQATLSGTGVSAANNEALVLRQTDGAFLVLLRKGESPAGIGTAKVLAISAVDVNPITGAYAVLTTLTGSPSNSNQALWTGCTAFGNDTSKQIRRLPQFRLRKGDHYSTDSTPLGLVKSMVLKPAVDATGAGGRGLAQTIGRNGHLVIYIVGAGGQTELVMLPQFIFPA